MLNVVIACRIPSALVARLDELAADSARHRSEVVRYLLARACREVLPTTWFEGEAIAAQRIVTGRDEPGTRSAS